MRPMLLELQAFGPFVGAERVDFETLGRDGPFLIAGETGAGKTSILDAMCFALYGMSSGHHRDNLEALGHGHLCALHTGAGGGDLPL